MTIIKIPRRRPLFSDEEALRKSLACWPDIKTHSFWGFRTQVIGSCLSFPGKDRNSSRIFLCACVLGSRICLCINRTRNKECLFLILFMISVVEQSLEFNNGETGDAPLPPTFHVFSQVSRFVTTTLITGFLRY